MLSVGFGVSVITVRTGTREAPPYEAFAVDKEILLMVWKVRLKHGYDLYQWAYRHE